MATQGILSVPPQVIRYTPPKDYVLESEKTPEWFTSYSRWIVANFYNQRREPFYQNQPSGLGVSEEFIENWSYVFASQNNKNFAYMQQDFSGNAIPAVWISGGKIGELYNHLRGRLLEDISNIEVSARNLSKGVASKRSEMFQKLKLKYELQKAGIGLESPGVDFNPVPMAQQFETIEEIREFTEKWQDEYSIMCEKIAQDRIESDYLLQKYLSCAQDQVVGGLSAMLTEVINGRSTSTYVPGYKVIWDNRVDDDYNKEAWLCGIMENKVPYQKVIEMFGADLSADDIEEIRLMANPEYNAQAAAWATYYNFSGNTNPIWWSNWSSEDMCISYARVWWIGPRDYRYKTTYNKFEQPRYKKIKDDDYYTIRDKDGNPTKVKGAEMRGDFTGYDIHTAVLIGNKYLVQHGYADNVVRPFDKRERPQLPMHIYCGNMALGGNRPIISRVKKNQDELDRLAYKIQQLTGRDNGKVYIINGNKIDVTSTELMSDMKIMGLHVSKGGSGEPDDPQDGQRTVEVIDMTLDPNVMRYIELRNEQKQEMNEIFSVSQIALGQQQNVIGKGVQSATISQNSYGTAGIIYGMMKFYEGVLQYQINQQQMLWAMEDSIEESLIIGDSGSELLKILNPKEFGSQHFKVFIKLSDFVDSMQKERIKSIALAQAQNGAIDAVDYIEFIELAKTPTQMIKGLRQSEKKKSKEISAAQQAQAQAEMERDAALLQAKQFGEAVLIQLKEDNANYREELKILSGNAQALQETLKTQPPTSPASQQLAAAAQPQQPQESQPVV